MIVFFEQALTRGALVRLARLDGGQVDGKCLALEVTQPDQEPATAELTMSETRALFDQLQQYQARP